MGTMIEPIIKARSNKGRTLTGDEPSAAADQTAGKHEACRTLYKALEELTATKYEITCHYFLNDWKEDPNPKTVYYKGDTLREAYTEYCRAGENHDLAKFTPLDITSIDTYTEI